MNPDNSCRKIPRLSSQFKENSSVMAFKRQNSIESKRSILSKKSILVTKTRKNSGSKKKEDKEGKFIFYFLYLIFFQIINIIINFHFK